jgi:hypothetical protein
MRTSSFLTIAGFVLLLGCAPGQVFDGNGNGQWEATLLPEAGFTGLSGQAQVSSLDWGTSATARVEGAEGGGRHAWHVHEGQCGDQGDVVGSQEAYPALEVGSDGSGEATAMVDDNLDSGEDYYVDIHPSTEDLETMIACGALLQTATELEPRDDEWNR